MATLRSGLQALLNVQINILAALITSGRKQQGMLHSGITQHNVALLKYQEIKNRVVQRRLA